MAINLQKGQTIDLVKKEFDLSSVTIGLGWDVNQKKKGFLASLFSSKENDDFDLDAIAFMLNREGKVSLPPLRKGGDVVFYNNLCHASGNVYHTGDNRVGGDGDSDDEQLIVKLDKIGPEYGKIVFLVSIYQGIKKNQNFGQVENAFIRAVDANGKEMLRYDLSRDESFDGKCSMIFGELYRHNDGWKFRAIGTPYPTDSFVEILKTHYL